MRIAVEGIPAAGRPVDFTSRDDWATSAAQRSLDCPAEQLEGNLTLHVASKRAGLVRVEGKVHATRPADCDRCGAEMHLVIDEDFTLLYAPEESGGDAFDGGEIELEVDDLDLGWYREGHVDLADVLREAITLALPARIMCADRAECDKRTDELLAPQGASAGHPAFEALSGLSLGSDETG